MLLCLSRGLCGIPWSHFGVLEKDVELAVCWVADKTGMGVRDGTQALIRSRQQQVTEMRPGTADESFEGQQVRGSRILGQAVPGVYGSAGSRAQVGVYLTGNVALQAADDLGLGFSFLGAAFDVGAGGRVGAHPGERDPPQGVVWPGGRRRG